MWPKIVVFLPKIPWFGRTFFRRGSAEASVRFGSVFGLVRFGSAEPPKARFGRTLFLLGLTFLCLFALKLG